ncbi:type II toxin-antitoxin system VapC family toxin [Chthonobacter albigriseus]|uniref:type II toxin-antitoxin system VapC family toxin n=1 Tax=Chthonobacter albigriseus TaxID=1683161 RepID=UPI0015EEC524|nr:type II toxin-antitoxin system VapC family toxin [Chthonobacter albigriseus]
MEAVGRLYLDTNIFIRAFEGTDELAARIRRLFYGVEGRPLLVTSQLTYAEAIQKPYAERNDRLIDLYSNWLRTGNNVLDVCPLDPDCLYYAAVLRSTYKSLKLPDAIHLSTAFGSQCTHFLSDDQRLPNDVAMSHHPHGLVRGPMNLIMLRPDRKTVDTLLEMLSP